MSRVAAKDIEGSPAKNYLPPFVAVYEEHTEIEATAKKQTLTSMAIIKGGQRTSRASEEVGSGFWVAVSGYRLECAALVYRFFLDIGYIVDKSFTSSDLMYLKYYCLMDCEMALSYDGQKIGYGADILVSVKPESPVFQIRIESTNAAFIEDSAVSQSAACVIDVEAIDNQAQPQPKKKPSAPGKRGKFNLLQWLKHKISYIFYLNET
ncbi:hypothetical protein AWZ03_007611 [Drosophila navojoa]|uniref:Nucleoporin NUP35 n=1 Tax=Drosophila navojoa TaxID=7232 RepID=A0A484BDM2_DRONA|nr:uncharacterized protein LOC108658375 [Drosophila navojoa]TDG45891.1 hypothetical protein AWZ03_007611 [Drosophila navojoa]